MKFSIKNERQRFDKPEDIQKLVASIESPKEITFLELTGNLIHPDVSAALCTKIGEMKKLKHLNFSRIVPTMPSIKMRETFDNLFKNIDPLSIQTLNISENALSWELPDGFCKFLVESKNLEYLKINDCGLGINGTTLLLGKLAEGKGKLKYLNISRNKITVGAEKIGKLINQLSSLETLKINSNTIYKESADILIEDIKELNLKELDLTDNNISPISCALLGKMFNESKMKKLQIGDCLIYDQGLTAFLGSYGVEVNEKKNVSLAELLDDLHLDSEGIINKIEIDENIQSTFEIKEGIIQREKAFQQTLDLSYNGLTQIGINQITEFMKNKENIKLYIYGNDYEDVSELVGVMEKNSGFVVYEEPDDEPSDPFTDISDFMSKVNVFMP
ncbi:Ran GTPase-activating protein 1 [Cucumispora dikerogammari]|nr:Ran GTPase-activating protein 1 [Cucumispora dikerogammari]